MLWVDVTWQQKLQGNWPPGHTPDPGVRDSQLLLGAWAPWDPCSNGFPFLGRRGLVLCLVNSHHSHVSVECLQHIMQDVGEQLPVDRCGPVLWAQQCSCAGSKGCVSFPHPRSLSPFSLSFLPFICPLHTPILRGLHPRKKAAGRVVLIPGHESLRVGYYHLAKRYFMMNEHVATPNTQFWIPCLWQNLYDALLLLYPGGHMQAQRAAPECQELQSLKETAKLANQQCILSLANKQLSGTAFLCWGS